MGACAPHPNAHSLAIPLEITLELDTLVNPHCCWESIPAHYLCVEPQGNGDAINLFDCSGLWPLSEHIHSHNHCGLTSYPWRGQPGHAVQAPFRKRVCSFLARMEVSRHHWFISLYQVRQSLPRQILTVLFHPRPIVHALQG